MRAGTSEEGKLNNVFFEKREILSLILVIMSGEIFFMVSFSERN
jgi:hypothetical protein